MNKEENVVFILQKAVEHFNIRVTRTTVKDFLLGHPYYPTLKSVCNALEKWHVEHYPLNLNMDEIQELDMPFIAHLKVSGGQLVFIEEIKNGQVNYFLSGNKIIREDFEKFSEKLSGAVVVMEGGKNSGEKDYRSLSQKEILNNALLPLCIIALITLATWLLATNVDGLFFHPGYLHWGLLATKILGLTASVFLVLHEFKISTPLADKICGFSSKTDCDTVLTSNASKLFGWINWADVGLVYFTGTILFLAGTNASGLGILSLLSVLALPYPVFSIYYQAFNAKKWCPFCLLVQLVLIAEFVLLFPVLLQVHFSVLDVLQLSLALLIPASLWLTYKDRVNKMQESNKTRYSYLEFKRSPQIFKSLLTSNGYEEISLTQDSLLLGNPDAPITITAFLSLYCTPCANAFKELRMLVDNCNDVKINMILSIYRGEAFSKLINHLYYHYYNDSSEAAIEYLSKWYSTNKNLRKSLYEKELPGRFDIVEVISKTNNELFDKLKISGTPTVFIEGNKFPSQFNYKDIEFFIDDIKKLNLESKRQEACANCH